MSDYDEVWRFITSAPKVEVERIQQSVHNPGGIIPMNEGGCFVQEGDDNVDINTETIDDNDTFHSMARVMCQQQISDDQHKCAVPIKRGKEKRLPLTVETDYLMQPLHFDKPRVRQEPPCLEKATHYICVLQAGSCININNTSWGIMRMLPREVVPVPKDLEYNTTEVVPFWRGYNRKLSKRKKTYTAVASAPIVSAKPSDIKTVSIAMKQCEDMSTALVQST